MLAKDKLSCARIPSYGCGLFHACILPRKR
jgi:hypothetical protein